MELTREQVEYVLISMRQCAHQTRLPFTFSNDDETYQAFNPSEEDQKNTIGDVPNSLTVSYDPPPTFISY